MKENLKKIKKIMTALLVLALTLSLLPTGLVFPSIAVAADIPADRIFYVSSTTNQWNKTQNVYTDPQKAINAANAKGTSSAPAYVLLAVGTYTPETAGKGNENKGSANYFELLSNVTIIGGFAGDETGTDPTFDQSIESSDDNKTIFSGAKTNVVILRSNASTQNELKNLVIANCNGSGIYDPGLYLNDSDFITLTNCTLKNNKTYGHGSAIRASSVDNLVINNCNFTGNFLPDSGSNGTIYAVGSSNTEKMTINNCTFEGNSSSARGGAIYSEITLIINYSSFVGNTSTNFGGAIFCTAQSTLTGCTFENNVSTSLYGGAIYADRDSTTNLNNCTFIGNKAISNTYGQGGAIYLLGSTSNMTMDNCTFNKNTAPNGGAIYVNSGASVKNNNCTFEENESPTSTGDGGAIYLNGSETNMTMDNCRFSKNTARRGGAIYINNGTLLKSNNCTFEENESSTSTGGGGAIYYTGTSSSSADFNNCTFAKNKSSDANGGAILLSGDGASMELNNCTFNENSTLKGTISGKGGSISVENNAVLRSNYCTFKDNISASTGGAIQLTSGSDVTTVNCIFENNKATANSYGGAIYCTGASGNISKLTALNCIFKENDASRGGAICSDKYSKATLANCVFTKNTATRAAVADGGTSTETTFVNCTIINNTSFTSTSDQYSAIYIDPTNLSAKATFYNTIVTKNNNHDVNTHSSAYAYENSVIGATYYDGTGAVSPVDPEPTLDDFDLDLSLKNTANFAIKKGDYSSYETAIEPILTAINSKYGKSFTMNDMRDINGNLIIGGEESSEEIDVGAFRYIGEDESGVAFDEQTETLPVPVIAAYSKNGPYTSSESTNSTVTINAYMGDITKMYQYPFVPQSYLDSLKLYYKIGDGSEVEYTGPITAKQSGTYNFYCKSPNGKESAVASIVLNIVPSKVDSITPEGNNAPINGQIKVFFDSEMNDQINGTVTLTPATITLPDGRWDANKKVYTIDYSGLIVDTNYTINIFDFESENGIKLQPYTGSFSTYLDRETTPTADFSYSIEKLTGLVANASYTVDGIAIVADDSGNITIDEDWFGKTISIIKTSPSANPAYNSFPQALPIPARPAAPTVNDINSIITRLLFGNPLEQGEALLELTNFEYKTSTSENWSDATLAAIEEMITGGSFEFRYKAKDSEFASKSTLFVVTVDGVPASDLQVNIPIFENLALGYSTVVPGNITLSNNGNTNIEILGVFSTDKEAFVIGGSGNTIEANDSINTWTVKPLIGLAEKTHSASVIVIYDGGAVIVPISVTVVVNAKTPVITTQPISATYKLDETAAPLSVIASAGAGENLSYQWYSNTSNTNTGGTLITNATSATYIPPTDAYGTYYYYCIVTNTDTSVSGSKTTATTSNACAITIKQATNSALRFDKTKGLIDAAGNVIDGKDDTWSFVDNTLTLNNFNYTSSVGNTTLEIPENCIIVLEGNNTLTNEYSDNDISFGIYSSGNLTFQGLGKLNINGGTNSSSTCYYGIFVNNIIDENIALTMNNGTINIALGNNSDSLNNCYGIYTDGNVNFNGGQINVNAKASSYSDNSRGVYVLEKFVMDGGMFAVRGNIRPASVGGTDGHTGIEIKSNKTANILTNSKHLFSMLVKGTGDSSLS